MDKEKENTTNEQLRPVYVTPEVHDLLWQFKVKHKKKSISEVASFFIKLGICNEEIGNG